MTNFGNALFRNRAAMLMQQYGLDVCPHNLLKSEPCDDCLRDFIAQSIRNSTERQLYAGYSRLWKAVVQFEPTEDTCKSCSSS
jgi:hypothetical protein